MVVSLALSEHVTVMVCRPVKMFHLIISIIGMNCTDIGEQFSGIDASISIRRAWRAFVIFCVLATAVQFYAVCRNRNVIENVVKIRFVLALATSTVAIWSFIFGLGVGTVVENESGSSVASGFGLVAIIAILAPVSDIADRYLSHKFK